MDRKPKHRELLRLFIRQPLMLCLFAAAVYSETWKAFFLLGSAVALFNIACDSAEIDFHQGRTHSSLVTVGLAFASTAFVVGLLKILSENTRLEALLPTTGGAVVVGLFMGAMLIAIDKHRKSFEPRLGRGAGVPGQEAR